MEENTPQPPASSKRSGPLASRVLRAGISAHAFLYRRGLARKMGRMPLILLTTTGRITGKRSTVPLGAVREGDGWVVIGSNGGADRHPGWWLNLVANPEASIQAGDQRIAVRMEEITDTEQYRRVWNAVVEHGPGYANYPKKTSRHIPLGWLRPLVT